MSAINETNALPSLSDFQTLKPESDAVSDLPLSGWFRRCFCFCGARCFSWVTVTFWRRLILETSIDLRKTYRGVDIRMLPVTGKSQMVPYLGRKSPNLSWYPFTAGRPRTVEGDFPKDASLDQASVLPSRISRSSTSPPSSNLML
ncbi:hypothetical protein RRG08_058483 [Elysia crispata]|uniref:Uncharacterized protein n=1 Tax=Elysia crispata TaxID=231223 RepID=A0AAE1CTG6_9GAST|nr:hypothetical protein RRG08_058483 [Elysia crispata]